MGPLSRRGVLALLALLALFALPLACQRPTPSPEGVPSEHDARMAWWREARFGMFLHWGLYAVPAGEWQGGTDYGEWIRDSARIPRDEYARFQREFDPVNFDADEWVRLAREAGMKYLVITSKHHDGFALFDSAHTDWDVMGTPFRRDILAELAAACGRGGVRFCTYHSIMDWHHPDYLPRRPWETDRPSAGADFERFEEYLHAQVREVVTKYRPGVMWFDGEWESTWTHARGVELFELCRTLDPAMLVNNRVDVHRGGMAGFSQASEAVGDFGTPEQEIPASGLPGVDWETCMTMNDHWGWNRADPDWKPLEVLVRNLIDVASKGGNYLLNVGPRADGTFPPQAVERLEGIGRWMAKHGEAIHGTSASPFEGLPWGRCTVKRNGADSVLYLHVFERPADGRLVLSGLGNELLSAGWLAGPRVLLPVAREGTDVVIQLPESLPDPIASVVTLGIRGAPLVLRAPEIVAAADSFVRPLTVEIRPAVEGIRYTLDGSDPTLDSQPYSGPIVLTEGATVSARDFTCFFGASPLAQRRFTRATPRPGVGKEPWSFEPGVGWLEVRGTFERLPEFPALLEIMRDLGQRPDLRAGKQASLELAPEQRVENLALEFSGRLEVPADDVYTFALASDDGSDLWIGSEQVVDNDGLHGMVEKRGQVALAKGRHAVRVRWFNRSGGAELSVRWAPLGGDFAPLELETLTGLAATR